MFVYQTEPVPKNVNHAKLEAIIGGETVQVTEVELGSQLPVDDLLNHTLCFRLVSPEFEGVRQAYPENAEPGMRFIQIYVEGDEAFALSDSYYMGGVAW